MKKHVKTTKNPDAPKTMNVKKHAAKPWMLEYKIKAGTDLTQWGMKDKNYTTWYQNVWYKYMSVEHALQQLNKDCRHFEDAPDWRIKDRELRLFNTSTNELVYLTFTGKELIVTLNTAKA